ARSGITAHWKAGEYQSILELAEACDVPVRWSCRTGVCHNCESGLVSGAVVYGPEPLDKPAAGNVLVCCSQPLCDVAVDLGVHICVPPQRNCLAELHEACAEEMQL